MKEIVINTASRQDLIDLKGIGNSLADKIIDARILTSESDIIAIKGIGKTSLNNIKANNAIDFVYDEIAIAGPRFSPFLNGPLIMRNDTEGDGHWGAERGSRDHLGLDIKCTAGETIFSPIQGKITKQGWPTTSKPNLRYIEVTGSGNDSRYRVRLMYSTLLFSLNINSNISRGDSIGIAQAVSIEYGLPNMIDHIHFVLFLDGSNAKVDPTQYVLG